MLKGRLKACDGLTVSVKKTKMAISGQNAVKVSVEGKFPIAVCR